MTEKKSKPNLVLKGLRVGKGLTQFRMAKIIGMGETSYVQKENGKKDFLLSEAARISIFFDMPIEDIFQGLFASMRCQKRNKGA